MNIPYISREQMRQVDDLMINKYRIGLLQMMEHAGYHTADFIRQRFPKNSHITILAGKGGNGGGVIVAARKLHAWGFEITVVLGQEQNTMAEVPKQQVEILQRLDVAFSNEIPKSTDIILDGVVGYSLNGDLKGRAQELVNHANHIDSTRVSLDIPSGLDPDSGPSQTVFAADYTLTLALPKATMSSQQSRKFLGQIHIVDIGIPPIVYEQLNIEVDNIFNTSSVVPINQ